MDTSKLDHWLRDEFPDKVPLFTGLVYDPYTFAPKMGVILLDKDVFKKYPAFSVHIEALQTAIIDGRIEDVGKPLADALRSAYESIDKPIP